MGSRFRLAAFLSGLAVVAVALVLMLQLRSKDEKKVEGKQPAGTVETKQPPSDEKAFYSTYGFTDPVERLEALEKFLRDFPASSQATRARGEIFKIVITRWPDDRKRVFDSAQRMIESGGAAEYQFIARELLGAELFLAEAEEFALKSVNGLTREAFFSQEKKSYLERTRPVPSDEFLEKEYMKQTAAYRTTLARIYLRRGKAAEGEKMLKEAYAIDPLLSPAAIGLAEIAEKKGDNKAAVDYLLSATITSGRSIADAYSRLEAVYRKTHAGSLDGMEAALDARYLELFPNPVQVEPYKPDHLRSDRVVLAEFFTGAG